MTMKYAITLTKEDDGYVVTFPDLPIVTQGDSIEEAQAMANDALDECLAGYINDGEDIPTARSKGKHYAYPSTRMMLRVLLYTEMRKQRVTPVQLAKRLGWKHPQAYRLLDADRRTDIGQFDQAFAALGRHIEVYTAA
jgi:predicted RNase H-like HicB family nuclease